MKRCIDRLVHMLGTAALAAAVSLAVSGSRPDQLVDAAAAAAGDGARLRDRPPRVLVVPAGRECGTPELLGWPAVTGEVAAARKCVEWLSAVRRSLPQGCTHVLVESGCCGSVQPPYGAFSDAPVVAARSGRVGFTGRDLSVKEVRRADAIDL